MFTNQKKSPRQELVTSLILPQSPKQQKNSKQLPQQSQPIKLTQSKILQQPIQSDYNNQQYLYKELENAKKLTSYPQKQIVNQYMNKIQTKAYDMETGEQQNMALQHIYKNSLGSNQYIGDEINKVVHKVSNRVAGDIKQKLKPRRLIPKNKDDIKELQKADKYRLIKIKNGEIKNKIGDLRSELQRQYFQKKASLKIPLNQDIRANDYYSMDNPRTHQANEFIHKIKQQRRQQRQRYAQILQRKHQEMRQQQQAEQLRRQAEAEQRKMRIQKNFLMKLSKRKQQQQQIKKKRQQYQQWSRIYKQQKPLFKKKQDFDKKLVIDEQQYRKQRLRQIRNQYKPIDMGEINEHDEKYLEQKRDNQIRLEAYRQMEKQKMQLNSQNLNQLYKGKYRYLALQQMMNQKMKGNQDPQQQHRQKKARQIVYADQLNDRLHQQIKLKKQQLQGLQQKTFVKRKRNIKGTTVSMDFNNDQDRGMSSLTDPKADGKKNLHYLKQLVRQKGIRKDNPIIRLVQQKNSYPDYLEQIKNRRKSMQASPYLHDEQITVQNGSKIKQLIAKQKNLNERVKRGQVRRKYNSLDYKQDASLQQNQIDAVKLKMKLINELH